MKQPISRNLYKRHNGVLAVYLQDGAPLTDAVWNEAADTGWSSLRDAIVADGLRGTAGRELLVAPTYDASDKLTGFVLRGGPNRFYCDGIPIAWPRDVAYGDQPCDCAIAPFSALHADTSTRPLVVWLETRIVLLDELDTPDLRDPAVQSDRGAFRRTVETCVRVAPVNAITPRVAALLLAADGVAEHVDLKVLPIPVPATTVRLTVQGAYDGEENVHYRVELVKHRGTFDKYTYAVELLWDDRNASTVTRLVSDADQYARSIDVQSSEGFATGDFLRLEGDGVDGQIYEVTDVDGSRLSIRRSLCCDVTSLVETAIVAYTVDGNPDDPRTLKLTLTLSRQRAFVVGDLVTGLVKSKEAAAIPHGDDVWKVAEVKEAGDQEVMIVLFPHFGLAAATSPWGPARTLMQHARIHEHCVVVEAAACWRPGMRVRITGKPRKTAGDPCWRPDEVDEGHECWPSRDPLFRDEDRTITWIERCGKWVDCCKKPHETMVLRLDTPLSADHSKCCDEVRPERTIKVRRYAGHECFAKLRAVWPCCDDTGGVCCLAPSFTLPSGLSVVLTYRGGTSPFYAPGDSWSFAARVGGWYEPRVFAEPEESLRSASLLALIVPSSLGPKHQFLDIRPIPAAHDQSGLLDEIARSSAELTEYFTGATQARFDRVATLARLPRLQANVAHNETWQLGMVELLYRIARAFVRTHADVEKSVAPAVLVNNDALAVAFRALAKATLTTRHAHTLSQRELKAIADTLSRAASVAAGILAADAKLAWPQLGELTDAGPVLPPKPPALPVCPDELPEPGDEPDRPDEPSPDEPPDDSDDLPERPPGRPDTDPDQPPERPPGRPDGEDEPLPERPPGRPDDEDEPPPERPPGRPEDEDEPRPERPPGRPDDEDEPLPERPPGRPDDDPPERPPGRPTPPPDLPGDLNSPDNKPDPPQPPFEPPIGIPDPEPIPPYQPPIGNPDPAPPPPAPPIGIPNPAPPQPKPPIGLPLNGDASGTDSSIGSESNDHGDLADPPAASSAGDLGLTDLSAHAGDEPDDRAAPVVERLDVLALHTEDLKFLRSLNNNTAHRIAAEWPLLRDVYIARSDGSVRKRVIAAVRRFVDELRAFLEHPQSDIALAEIWARHIRAAVPPPSMEFIALSLPAPDSGAGEEE